MGRGEWKEGGRGEGGSRQGERHVGRGDGVGDDLRGGRGES